MVTIANPLYNLEPSTGEPARFGFYAVFFPVILDTSVRTGEDYGVTVTVPNITQTEAFLGSEVTFWGVPGDERHETARGSACLEHVHNRNSGTNECKPLGEHFPSPFLTLPTSCTGRLSSVVEADSWLQEEDFLSSGTVEPMQALDGCNRLQFDPSITVAPDGQAGSTPTGLKVGVNVPQSVSLDAEGLAEADVKNTTVTLPEGVALNPAAADGLSVVFCLTRLVWKTIVSRRVRKRRRSGLCGSSRRCWRTPWKAQRIWRRRTRTRSGAWSRCTWSPLTRCRGRL